MSVTMEKTVREWALENPGAARVFEKLGIDYCCGGQQSLEQACRVAGLSMDSVLEAVADAACRGENGAAVFYALKKWQKEAFGKELLLFIKNQKARREA